MLDKLEALARQGAAASADAVLDLVVDLFAARAERMRPASRDACLELLLLTMRRASSEGRGAAACRLAQLPSAPPAVLMALAREAIDVAGPVLQHGRNLSGANLVRLVSEASPEHLRAVARRDGLSEAVTNLILLRGDREAVILSLLNRQARLSRASLVSLADKARSDTPLRSALTQRSDLPEPVVDRLWPLLDAGGKARLVAAGWRYSRQEIDEVARETAGALVATLRRGAMVRSVDTYRALVEDGAATLSEALTELLEAGRWVEAAQFVARRIGLEEGVALNLLSGVYDRGFAVLARGAGLDEASATRFAYARLRLPSTRAADIRPALRAFAEVGEAEARDILDILEALWAVGVTEGGARPARRRVASAA